MADGRFQSLLVAVTLHGLPARTERQANLTVVPWPSASVLRLWLVSLASQLPL
jgi:hypothetical protein